MDYVKDWASRLVKETNTAAPKKKLTRPMEIRNEFFERLSALVLKPVAIKDKTGPTAHACFLMPETLQVHVVSVAGYKGMFYKNEPCTVARISMDRYQFYLPEKYDWAWREVYGERPARIREDVRYFGIKPSQDIQPHGKSWELSCAIGELPDLAVWVYKILDDFDRNGSDSEIEIPFGVGESSSYMWTAEGLKQQKGEKA